MLVLLMGLTFGIAVGDSDSFVPINPKDDVELVAAQGDTIKLVTCADHVYDPFGRIRSISDIARSPLKRFRLDSLRRDELTYFKLAFHSSKFILLLDIDSDGPRSAYVIKGELLDPGIAVQPGIHIGMSRAEFFASFFKRTPRTWEKVNHIVFESCVYGARQLYSFKGNRLVRVTMTCLDCVHQF